MDDMELVTAAFGYMERARAPYSHFKVGAALLCADGTVFGGCNIENASYGATMCAERCAASTAVAEGKTEFVKIAVVGGHDGIIKDFTAPCGICRQFLSELCGAEFEVLLYDGENIKKKTLGELLPDSFSLEKEYDND